MHLEATGDLGDREQMKLVAVPIAEHLEESLSDEVDQLQVKLGRHRAVRRGRCSVVRRVHVLLSEAGDHRAEREPTPHVCMVVAPDVHFYRTLYVRAARSSTP